MVPPILHFPFDGNFPVTFGFGDMPEDPAIAEKYREWGLAGHNGIDFGLPEGTQVLACAEGTVLFAGEKGDFGTCVIVTHDVGQSWYAHLSSSIVAVDQNVQAGQILGLSGHSGFTFGPHLHFGMKPNNPDPANGFVGFIDPTPYFYPQSALSGIASS